ncbi:MAG: gliding motility-associated C-terminal domain-containing protein [Cytophagales bacterium]|nr:MAG: gliding motility-associated C-terminal domain-containing protein [Cytophagales bacterium]
MKIITKSFFVALCYFFLVLCNNNIAIAGVIPGCVTTNHTAITIRPLCKVPLKVTGMLESSIEWKIKGLGSLSINDYLSCTQKCSTTVLSPPDASVSSFTILIEGEAAPSCIDMTLGSNKVELIIEVKVENTDPLTASISPNPASFCDGSAVTITANPSGGKAPYTYLWNNTAASTTSNISVSSAATYEVSIKDAFLVCESIPISSVVTATPVPSYTLSSTNALQCGQSTGTINFSGLLPSTTYTFGYQKNGASEVLFLGNTNSSGSLTILGLGAGTYTNISATLNGCTFTSPNTIIISDPIPPTNTTSSAAICADGISTKSLISNITGGTWVIDATESTSGVGTIIGNTFTSSMTAGTAVVYYVAQACTSAVVKFATVAKPLIFVSTSNITNCASPDGRITLSSFLASSQYSLGYTKDNVILSPTNFTTNSSGQIQLTGLGAGTYKDFVLIYQGCITTNSSTTVVLTSPTIPNFTVSVTNPSTCNSSDGFLSISGLSANTMYSTSYSFNNNPVAAVNISSNASGNLTISNLAGGSYTNITLVSNGCSGTNSNTYILTSPSAPTNTTSNTSMCADGANTRVLVGSPAGGVWSLATGSTSSIGTISGTTFTVGSVSGTAIVSYTVLGCSTNVSFMVNALPTITVSKVDPATCGGTGTVNIAIGNAAGNYDVDLNGDNTYEYTNLSTSAGNIIITNLAVGTVINATKVRSVSSGCISAVSTLNTTIIGASAPTNSTSTTSMCADGASTRVLVGSPAGGVWSLATGSTASIGTISGTTFTVGSVSGTAIVSYTVSGCSTNVSFIVNALPVVSITNPSPVCAPSTVNLTSASITSGSSLNLNYTYFTDAAATTVLSNPSAVSQSGTYFIRGANANGCSVVRPVVATINSAVTANAGSNQSICGNSVSLSGTATSGSSVSWTSSIAGSFSPNNTSLTTTFTPTLTPTSSFTISLIASIGVCTSSVSSITVNILARPQVNAGADQSLCSNVNLVNLSGSINPSNTPIVWTTLGSGSFINSSATLLAATYSPSNADKTNGVRLVLSSTNASCNSSDTVLVNFNPTPSINAGAAQTKCSGDRFATLSPTISPSNTPVLWTSSGTGTFVNANVANARYNFSPQDSANGSVTLTVTSQNSGNCNANSNVVITINQSPYISVLPNYDVCSFGNTISLVRGTLVPSNTPVEWTVSGGTGTFENPTSLNTNYQLSNADKISNGSPIYLILRNTSSGCQSRDTAVLRTQPSGVPLPGSDINSCSDVTSIPLNGNVFPSSAAVRWTTNGTGTFSNDLILRPNYIPSAADKSNGNVTLTLRTTGFGSCNIGRALTLSFTTSPNINAGPIEVAVCRTTPNIALSGTVSPSSTPVRWSTSGSGNFGNATSLNTIYTFTNRDRNDGEVYLILRSTNTSCNARDSIKVTFANAPIVSAGTSTTRCSNNPNLQLNGLVSGSTNTGEWTTSGSGTFVPNNQNLAAIYTPSESDKISGSDGVTLTLTSTNNGTCPAVSGNFKLSFTLPPIVSSGGDRTICANSKQINLNGSVSGSTTTGVWTTSGDGTFSSANSMTSTYFIGNQDSINGRVTITLSSTNNGNCNPESKSFVLTITPSPIVNAGANQTICDNLSTLNLQGSVSGVTNTGVWSTNGSGTFVNESNLQTTYRPSNLDKVSGVILKLTSTNNGICLPSSKSKVISFSPSPLVNAGNDITICESTNSVSLSGQISGVTSSGTWSSTSLNPGTFTNASNLNTIYTPSSQEKASGSVTLTLTSTNNQGCNPSTDQLKISFTPSPRLEAGANQTLCANVTNITLNGQVSGSTNTGVWTSNGNGIFEPSNEALNAKYIPSNAERSQSFIVLTLTSTNNGDCGAVADNVRINFTTAPTSEAGTDVSVCANNANIGLNGKVTGAIGGLWTTNGQGTFSPNNTALNATYIPGSIELESGSVTLTLTTTGNQEGCNSVSSQLSIFITKPPVSNAGSDLVICKNDPLVQLNGQVSGRTTTGVWSSLGTGRFVTPNSDLNARYDPSDADILNGVSLVLASTNNFNCIASRDTIKLTFSDSPVNAGLDIVTCTNSPSIALGGSISGTNARGRWTSSGTGRFVPSNEWIAGQTSNEISYEPSITDKQSRSPIRLTLTATTSNSNCIGSNTDNLDLTINPSPEVTVMADKEVCSNTSSIPISGNVSIATGGVWSTVRGTGSFSPSNSSLNTNYLPSKQDLDSGFVRLRLTSIGNGVCKSESKLLNLKFEKLPTLSAGVNQTICNNIDSIRLNGIVSNASGGSNWTSSGTGIFVPTDSELKASYFPSKADIDNKRVILTLTTQAGNVCGQVSNSINIDFIDAIQISAGLDTTLCTNAIDLQLSARTSAVSPVSWTSSGKGTFSNANLLNPKYTFDQQDYSNTELALTVFTPASVNCPSSKSTIKVRFNPKPTSIAGNDTIVCENKGIITLKGKVLLAEGGKWSSNGTGSFENSNLLSTFYTPSSEDYLKGVINIVLTTTGNGNCLPVNNSLVVNFVKAPVLDAGKDQKVCSGDTAVFLSGNSNTFTNSEIEWSSLGTGVFSSSSKLFNTTYSPSLLDKQNGSVKLILKPLLIKGCEALPDTIKITFTETATVNAGSDIEICANQLVALAASISGGGSEVKWSSTGSGEFKPSDITLNTLYKPSENDVNLGAIDIRISVVDACSPVEDMVKVIFIPTPIVRAGSDQQICEGITAVDINGFISEGGISKGWKTAGDGNFTNVQGNAATYQLGAAELQSGIAKLVFSSESIGICPEGNDTLIISVLSKPKVEAGSDLTACSNGVVDLNGIIIGSSGKGIWSTNGTGQFLPSDTLLKATYSPSLEDITRGKVKLTLSSINQSNCPIAQDSLMLSISQSVGAKFDAGSDKKACVGEVFQIGSEPLSGYTYNWTPTEGLSNFSISNPTVNITKSPIADTIYTYIATVVEERTQCLTKDTVLVNLNAKPNPIAIDNSTKLCGRAISSLEYKVFGATSSTFNWQIKNGVIVSGNGSNSVIVNWNEGLGQTLTVTEVSTSGCRSDELKFNLNLDTAGVVIKTVTRQFPNNGSIIVSWSYTEKNNIPQEIVLLRRKIQPILDSFKEVKLITSTDSSWLDIDIDTGAVIYEYKIRFRNSCDLIVETAPHRNINLNYEELANSDVATLTWSSYTGWATGVKYYEVLRKIDNESYQLIATTDSVTTSYTISDTKFINHCYTIKAVQKGSSISSYSNEVCKSNQFAFVIPNAISPNGDDINDLWEIQGIEFFRDNEVVVFNQWDSEVFRQKSYNNLWKGDNLPDGTYYYHVKAGNKFYKGYLLIVR